MCAQKLQQLLCAGGLLVRHKTSRCSELDGQYRYAALFAVSAVCVRPAACKSSPQKTAHGQNSVPALKMSRAGLAWAGLLKCFLVLLDGL